MDKRDAIIIADNSVEEKITIACIVSDSYMRQFADIHRKDYIGI